MHSSAVNITQWVSAITLVVLTVSLLSIIATLIGHRRRDEQLQHMNRLMGHCRPLLDGVLTGQIEYARGRDTLRAMAADDRTRVLEQLLLEGNPKPDQVPVLRRLCEELGLVEIWQGQLAGPANSSEGRDADARRNRAQRRARQHSFLRQATAAHYLGLIRHQPSWPLFVRALSNLNPDLAAVAARSLAAIGEPESFPALVDQLHSVLLDPATSLSLRSIKAALISFPLECAEMLLPSLTHANGRIRFVAVDIIREMVERRARTTPGFVLDLKTFPPQLTKIFLERLCRDDSLDVRARASGVIAHMADPRATSALLDLLDDAEWPVRLHAVRALAKPRYASEAAVIARRLTDSRWRVREAAARSLVALGSEGLHFLFRQFLVSGDKYSQEQIAEEIQRAGLLPQLLGESLDGVGGKAIPAAEQLALVARIDSHILESLKSLGSELGDSKSPSTAVDSVSSEFPAKRS
ncbi:MAG: HEAT repeat domain-containing protein [Terriglobia bacterium]|jgi:HEAT repeat protein